jgi:hypothetical protein
VDAVEASHRAAFVVRVPDVVADPGPALVAGHAECPRGERAGDGAGGHTRDDRPSCPSDRHALHL